MPGSGINPGNIAEIERITKASEFHSTARTSVPDPDRHHVPALGFDESADTGVILRTTREVVKALVNKKLFPCCHTLPEACQQGKKTRTNY